MLDVLDHISEIHKNNSAKSARDYKLCAKYANLSQLIAILVLGTIHQSPAFFNIFAKGTILPSCNIYLPGVNEFDMIDLSVILLVNVVASMLFLTLSTAAEPFVFL